MNVEKAAHRISLHPNNFPVLFRGQWGRRATSNVINIGEKMVDRLKARWETSSSGVRHDGYEGTGV